jgi:hypothetical protein
MIRRSIRCLAYTARRRPIGTLLLLIGTLAITFALLGTFYWEFWETPSSWRKGKGEAASTGEEDLSGGQNHGTIIEVERYRRPEPLQCDTQPIPSSFLQSSKYCSWEKTLQKCYQMLEERMKHATTWVLLGARDMSTLADFVTRKWPYHDDEMVQVTTRRHSCQNLLYYELPPPSYPWVPRNVSLGEGPTGYGLDHRYCADCRNCWNVLVDASASGKAATANINLSSSQQQQKYVEYLVAEFARDVTIQTSLTNTTQETIAYYLRLRRPPPQVCVVSVGLFDASIPNLSEGIFLQNVDRFLGLLQRACENVVWLSIPAVVEDESIPQYRNCDLQRRNVAIMDMLAEKDYYNLFVLDIWQKSLVADHSGFLQLSNRFHASLARLFVALMVGQDDSQRNNPS